MHDIFISYSHQDKQVATMVLSVLERSGIKCWIDYRDALPGNSFAASIVRAIKECKYFILLLSTSSGESTHVLNEVNSAVKAGKTIVPFKIDNAEMSDGMEYYVGKTHWLEALTPPMEAHINHLADTIKNWRGDETTISANIANDSNHQSKSVCRMVTLQELLALGYTVSSIAVQLVENDYINCNGIAEENEGTAAQWEEFLQNDSDTFQYLVNSDNKIIGDWSIVALTDEAFELAVKGELLERDLGIDNTNMLCFPDIYNGYLLTFSLLPEYRNMQNYNLLIESFLTQLERYSENGIFFRSWCINVFGREVEALVKRLGFKYICNNKVLGKIYTCSFMPLPDIPLIKKYKVLVENYQKAISEH